MSVPLLTVSCFGADHLMLRNLPKLVRDRGTYHQLGQSNSRGFPPHGVPANEAELVGSYLDTLALLILSLGNLVSIRGNKFSAELVGSYLDTLALLILSLGNLVIVNHIDMMNTVFFVIEQTRLVQRK
ncbi:hypothetical protein FALBO_4568 [Fusarium albosuccineum]|uniref:Uncharacterized protein n=1 Tax=Fusarium albosuccineum TaxID=1237068 RepID=A0A8H4LHQ6_9HYPO|nr:hypothetical protein FALBO_4568 [Fusarium albosuccineum]